MSFLKAVGKTVLSGLGIFALALLSFLLGWGFWWGTFAGLFAVVITWLIARTKKNIAE